ncbi:MAG: protein arginine kinase [Candidatus Latescibacterota bacterium]|nr:MAG: protein arginine kinase [Candidatus Latescibacterota bacterium]
MTLEDLAHHIAAWLDGSGTHSDMVVSSRVRLARNLEAFPFVHRASEEQLSEIAARALTAGEHSDILGKASFFDTSHLSEILRQVLVERHLISPALAKARRHRGILVEHRERCSVMINEEDHLRIQTIQSGFEPQKAWALVDRMDDDLSCSLDYAYSEQWGYLTACPTNVGTGLRASVLIHLPGLVLTQQKDAVLRGVSQVGLVARGFYGEGSEVIGNLFQISNQVTLGRNEQETIGHLEKVTRELIRYEEHAREQLIREARFQIEDKIWRALAILENARLLTSREFMNLASAVRLGISMNVISQPDIRLLNELMVTTQPSHLQQFAGQKLDPAERDVLRARLVRERLHRGDEEGAEKGNEKTGRG